MNFVENNGKKVAAVLCVASCFPVVATVYAMETEPGWHGDKYINEDTTVAKGWQEIEGKSYYFAEEDGTVDETVTKDAVVANVSTTITEDVQATVDNITELAVQSEIEASQPVVDEVVEAPVEEVEVPEEVVTPEAPVTPVEPEEVVTPVTPETPEETVTPETPEVPEEVVTPEVPETPVTPEVPETPETPEVPEAPVTPEVPETPVTPEVPEAPVTPEVPETPVTPEVPETPVTPEVPETPEEVVTPEVPTTPETSAPSTGGQYDDLNNRIAEEAKKLVGVTNGQWCTEVATAALANAGVSDAQVLWPDQYIQYGYYTDTPVAGNLIYYDNGGRGVDHIAVYIGNGQAVHGMWTGGITTIASVNINGGTPQYIQVTR